MYSDLRQCEQSAMLLAAKANPAASTNDNDNDNFIKIRNILNKVKWKHVEHEKTGKDKNKHTVYHY